MSIFKFSTGYTGIKALIDHYVLKGDNWIFRFHLRKSDGEIATSVNNSGAGKEVNADYFWNGGSVTSPQTLTGSSSPLFPVEIDASANNGTVTHLLMRAEHAGSGVFLDFAEGPFSSSFDFPSGYILRITSYTVLISVGDVEHSV